MRFSITLQKKVGESIPINYQYPLSAAIYKILEKADGAYAAFLHESGYGKGYKLFCFSDLKFPFQIIGDKLKLLFDEAKFEVSFHLPEASQHFIKGLFLSQNIDIADKKSKATFTVSSVEALPNPFAQNKENEIVQVAVQAISPCVSGIKNEKGNYDFLSPEDERFCATILYNWKEKIKTVFKEVDTDTILLSVETIFNKLPPKSRLISIKAGTPAETKIRGFTNFGLKIIGEKRFVELLYNSGIGVYNGQGFGMISVVNAQ